MVPLVNMGIYMASVTYFTLFFIGDEEGEKPKKLKVLGVIVPMEAILVLLYVGIIWIRRSL